MNLQTVFFNLPESNSLILMLIAFFLLKIFKGTQLASAAL